MELSARLMNPLLVRPPSASLPRAQLIPTYRWSEVADQLVERLSRPVPCARTRYAAASLRLPASQIRAHVRRCTAKSPRPSSAPLHPSSIVRFAQRYGYLGVLSEAPRRKGGIFVKAAAEYWYSGFLGVLAEAQSGSESLDNWYFWSQNFHFAFLEAQKIRANDDPTKWDYEEFQKLYGRVEPSKEKVNQWRLSRLSYKLTSWLHLGGAGGLVVNCGSLQLETHCAFSALPCLCLHTVPRGFGSLLALWPIFFPSKARKSGEPHTLRGVSDSWRTS